MKVGNFLEGEAKKKTEISVNDEYLINKENHKVFVNQDNNITVFEVDTLIFENKERDYLFSMIFCEDKTKGRKLDEKFEALKKLSIAGELAAGAVHEIKNPLSAIRGFVQLLEKSFQYEDKRKEYSNIILKELDRLTDLIREFLIIAKPSEAKYTMKNINTVIKDMICLIEPKAIIYNILVKAYLSEDIPEIKMNVEHIKQVFLNLFNNAVDAMCDGGELFIASSFKDNNVIIEIKDTGQGISPDETDKIYEPFYTTKKEGTGLGLSICKKIIENHKGTISLNSKVGKGTTFTIILPVKSD